MKKYAKSLVASILGWQVRRLRKKTKVKVIAVAGSIGKTSTKFATATVLGAGLRVRWQKGNYNDIVSVPLVFFDLPMPNILNPFSWAVTFLKIENQLAKDYPVDVVVLELGTDFPGNLAQFKSYVQADIGVLTAITPEHMEFFPDIDAVAREELTIAELSDKLLINSDLCDEKYLREIKDYQTYGIHHQADYRLGGLQYSAGAYDFTIYKSGQEFLKESHASIAETQLLSITAAVAVADMLGLDEQTIRRGIEAIKPVSGRMQRLHGIKNSVIIDDTYNASPEAAKAALDTLYKIEASQKIALLGNMNELGSYSEQAHKEVGAYCDPKQLGLVVTLGPDANIHLADSAEGAGCRVIRSNTPYEAAEVISKELKDNAVILAKGSQNNVFAEEAVKQLLASKEDAALLVRQSDDWMKKKQKAFTK